MNLGNLPEGSPLRELLKNCDMNHEIAVTACHDGAIVVECFECVFHYIMNEEEEKSVQEEEVVVQQATGSV